MFDTVPLAWLAENADVLAPRAWNEFFGRNASASYEHYVTSTDGTRVTLLAGPFPSEAEARRWVASASELLLGVGATDAARGVRTTRLLTHGEQPGRPGDLNALLGLPA